VLQLLRVVHQHQLQRVLLHLLAMPLQLVHLLRSEKDCLPVFMHARLLAAPLQQQLASQHLHRLAILVHQRPRRKACWLVCMHARRLAVVLLHLLLAATLLQLLHHVQLQPQRLVQSQHLVQLLQPAAAKQIHVQSQLVLSCYLV